MSPVSLSLVPIVSVYAYANVLIVAAAGLVAGIRALNGILIRPLTFRHLLLLGRILAITTVLLPILAMWHGGSELSPLKAQVWAASSMHTMPAAMSNDARIEFGVEARRAWLPVNAIATVVALLFAGGVALMLMSLLYEARATSRTIQRAVVLRSVGSVRILISDHEQVPFAAWVPGRAYIVLPATLLLRPTDLLLALAHEGQHHRQGDTRYLYAVLLGRALFGANPAVHWLARQLFELQELACDEALAHRPSHCADTYCACLLRVAEAALHTRQTQLRSFMASWHASALRRRVEAAFRRPVRSLSTPAAVGVSLTAILVLGTLSAVIAAPVQDRRLSRSDAEQLVAATPDSSAWGLRVNEAVLKQLNLLLGTPDGREFVRSSMERMRAYEPGVVSELKKYGLPMQLRVCRSWNRDTRTSRRGGVSGRDCGCSSAPPPAATGSKFPPTGTSGWILQPRPGLRCGCFPSCSSASGAGHWS